MKKLIAVLTVAAFTFTAAAHCGKCEGDKAKDAHKCSDTCKDKCAADKKASDDKKAASEKKADDKK